jgi:hypothetical protein
MQIRTDKNARVHPATGPGTGTCVLDNVKALLLRDFTHSERAFKDYQSKPRNIGGQRKFTV